jgi:hypothetical protein
MNDEKFSNSVESLKKSLSLINEVLNNLRNDNIDSVDELRKCLQNIRDNCKDDTI